MMIYQRTYRLFLPVLLILGFAVTVLAQVPSDCAVSDDVYYGIRRMLTAYDNGTFFEIWTPEEIACACIEIYYNDPVDADFHDAVITGAVALLGKTNDRRAVPVLIDAINTHPAQALFNLGNFPTVDAINALTAHVRDENPEARENAAEGLRHMRAPSVSEMEDGWATALESAIDEVGDWMLVEDEPTFREYFLDAYSNLQNLIESSKATVEYQQ
jgi:hypothetical protein